MAPDGTFYFSIASEGGMREYAQLNTYDYDTNEIKMCFHAAGLIVPTERQMPHSKLHTSINFIPAPTSKGYYILATTHSTDRAAPHSEWLPYAHHSHVWDGFPGSNLLFYDPETGHSENWGVPVPRESIYGAKYDPKHNMLYMIGFMRGHVYQFSLDTRKVKDLGKAVESCCYCLAMGADDMTGPTGQCETPLYFRRMWSWRIPSSGTMRTAST